MSSTTEQKILDAALEIFSKNGYNGARTRIIAEKSGFTEMTLFRKFKTKENLFNQVLVTNQERIIENFDSLLFLDDIPDPKVRFSTLIRGLHDLVDKNFEYVNIIIYEHEMISNSISDTFISHLGDSLEKFFPKMDLNQEVFSFMILSFLYFTTFEKKIENANFDADTAVSEFIRYHSQCLQL